MSLPLCFRLSFSSVRAVDHKFKCLVDTCLFFYFHCSRFFKLSVLVTSVEIVVLIGLLCFISLVPLGLFLLSRICCL